MIDIFDDSENTPTPPAQAKKRRAAAVAIRHALEGGKLPEITASGYGKLAEKIVQIAFENGVRVREDADLAQLLATLDLEAEIPPEALYAVAEVLSYVYRANGQIGAESTLPGDDDTP